MKLFTCGWWCGDDRFLVPQFTLLTQRASQGILHQPARILGETCLFTFYRTHPPPPLHSYAIHLRFPRFAVLAALHLIPFLHRIVDSFSRGNAFPWVLDSRREDRTKMAQSNSMEQASTNYKEAFALFDKRGNQRVALESLGDLLRACGQNPTLAEIRELEKNVGSDCSLPLLSALLKPTFLGHILAIGDNKRGISYSLVFSAEIM